MYPYACISYATADRIKAGELCHLLEYCGFRYRCIDETGDPAQRATILDGSVMLLSVTSEAASATGSGASDIRRMLERGKEVLCIGTEPNELDERFCADGCAEAVAYLPGGIPDSRTVSLFIHRLFIRRLCRHGECFSDGDASGKEKDKRNRSEKDTGNDRIGVTGEKRYREVIRQAVAAHAGDRDARYALGCAYERGDGLPLLETEAAYWIGQAAEDGLNEACIRMGELYLEGKGVGKDPEKAFRQFEKAAHAGEAQGYYHIGLCCLRGEGIVRDPERAIHYLRLAAEKGYRPALYRLSLLYRDGIGTPADGKEALRCLFAVCRMYEGHEDGHEGETGNIPPVLSLYGRNGGKPYRCISMRQMRRVRLSRLLTGDKDPLTGGEGQSREAVCFGKNRVTPVGYPEDRWLEQTDFPGLSASAPDETTTSSGKDGKREAALAAFALAGLLTKGSPDQTVRPSLTRALVFYRFAVRLGYGEALFGLGEAYRKGKGVPANPERAVRLYRMAAGAGSVRARFAVGVCCEKGIGGEVDLAEAVRCYTQAAGAGYAPAETNLGGCYEYGRGVVQNEWLAVDWYMRAAKAHQPDAACRLGLCYESGRGVETDRMKAFRLYRVAALQGHAYALYRLALCYDYGIGDRDGLSKERESAKYPDSAGCDTPEHPLTAGFPQGQDSDSDRETRTDGGQEGGFPDGETEILLPHFTYAARLYEAAAEKGLTEARYALYLCYHHGRGVHRDDRTAFRCLSEAAEKGHIQALYELGMCYMNGHRIVRNYEKATDCFRQAAERYREELNGKSVHHIGEKEILPPDALSSEEAAGGALYMLGYACLYRIGEMPLRPLETEPTDDPGRIRRSAAFMEQSARTGHVGALTALGDFYAYGLIPSDRAGEKALGYYQEATSVKRPPSAIPETRPINAWMGMYARAMLTAQRCVADRDPGGAEMSYVQAWKALSACAGGRSVDALLALAECTHYGRGTTADDVAAEKLLTRAETVGGGRVTASLWIGDMHWKQGDLSGAEKAYLKAIRTPTVASECGNYTLKVRRQARRDNDRRARAEACYRLSVLYAVHPAEDVHGNDNRAFAFLCEAVRMGHPDAMDDMARIYSHETALNGDDGAEKTASRGKRTAKERADLRHQATKAVLSAVGYDGYISRKHRRWMKAYYTALCPVPEPFTDTLSVTADPETVPAYVTAPVTPDMRVSALNYLGDCLFFAHGLRKDRRSAAEMYREAVSIPLSVPRGKPLPAGAVWAKYSYGFCLLHGEGVRQDTRAAVRYLTEAASGHGEAAFTLAECYEKGIGVDVADEREAIKFYRKALKFGCRPAKARLNALNRRLQERES